jgi:hypothetical protein
VPRTAFALPCAPHEVEAWRRAADHLLRDGARAHRESLARRGIRNERIWLQARGLPTPATLVLWDCDDVDVAWRGDGSDGEHDRWVRDVLLHRLHAASGRWAGRPETELVGGTTTMLTAVAAEQAVLALPIPEGRLADVRAVLAEREAPRGQAAHQRFLAAATVREEWTWLQHARGGLPDLLLVHWIGDDLDRARAALADPGSDPGACALANDLLRDALDLCPRVLPTWRPEPLSAMHVRRGDLQEAAANRLRPRIEGALAHRRWGGLLQVCRPVIRLHDRPVDAETAVAHVAGALGGADDVQEILLGERQVVATVRGRDGSPLALVLEVEDGAVAGMALLGGTVGGAPPLPAAVAACP